MYWFRKYFSEPSVHLRAIAEVIVIFAWSIVPLIITSFIRYARSDSTSTFQTDDIFSKGQIYLLAYSLCGTIFWLAFLRGDKPRHDARAFLGTISLLLILPVIAFIGVDPTFSTVINKEVVTWSYWFYGFLLVIYYLLLFYSEINPPDPQDVFDRGREDLDNRYNRYKHGS